MPLSDDLELLGYSGFRFIARLPKVDLKPGYWLYYLNGYNVYEGPPGKQRVVRKGIGIKDIVNAGGGVCSSDPASVPDGFEYSVIYRTDDANGISGFYRSGYVDPTHHTRAAGGFPFTLKVPHGGYSSNFQDWSLIQVKLGEEVEFASRTFVPAGPDGKSDEDHAVTVKWYFIFQVAPERFKVTP